VPSFSFVLGSVFTGTLVGVGPLALTPVDGIGVVGVVEVVALVPEVPGTTALVTLVTLFAVEDTVRPVVVAIAVMSLGLVELGLLLPSSPPLGPPPVGGSPEGVESFGDSPGGCGAEAGSRKSDASNPSIP